MKQVDDKEPFERFTDWFDDAKAKEPSLPEAMALATTTKNGFPSMRMVLLKGYGPDGFVFYSNTESRKGLELDENPNAALLFHWKSCKCQVRIEGRVERVSDAEADAYFASRDKDSQIGAWASKQSRPMKGRFEFEAEIVKFAAKYALKTVDRPDFWAGYRVVPSAFEFWQERRFRLHDRFHYVKSADGWSLEVLYP